MSVNQTGPESAVELPPYDADQITADFLILRPEACGSLQELLWVVATAAHQEISEQEICNIALGMILGESA